MDRSNFHASSPYGSGMLRLFDYGRYTAPDCGGSGRWEHSAGGEFLVLRPDRAPCVELTRTREGFGGTNWKLTACEARFEGFWNSFDPSSPVYAPIAKLPLSVASVWGAGQRAPRHDLSISGENARVCWNGQEFAWEAEGATGRSDWFFGVPKVDHPRALHVPHFYDYWSRLGSWKPERRSREPAIAFVARNLGGPGKLSLRRLEIARQLSKWFPLAVSERLKDAFDRGSKVTCWNVPSTVRGKYQFLSRFRFNLCFENASADGYLTEKLFDAVYSGCVPLYEGDPAFGEWFDDSCVIGCAGLSAEDIADRIIQAAKDGLCDRVDEERERLIRVGFDEMLARIAAFADEVGSWKEAAGGTAAIAAAHVPPRQDELKQDAMPGRSRRKPGITAVISVHRGGKDLETTLASFREAWGDRLPVVVADSEPTPLSERVREEVSYVRMPAYSGRSAARNKAVALADTEYVLIGNEGWTLASSPEELDRCLGYLDEGWDLVGSGAFRLRADGKILFVASRPVEETARSCDATPDFFLARRDLLLRVPWDEDLQSPVADIDHFLRLGEAGARIGGTSLMRFEDGRQQAGNHREPGPSRCMALFTRKWGFEEILQEGEELKAGSGVAGDRPDRIVMSSGRLPQRDGWLNLSQAARPSRMASKGLTNRLPLDDGSVEVAWVDRVIERLDYAWGRGLIGELYRVLKPGGRLRIETFDLGFLNRLASGKLGDSGADYVKWATDSFIPDAPGYDASFVVNHQMRAWGHRFLHDETTLADLLEAAGFREPVRCRCGQSQWEDLAGLESGPRAPGGFHVLETLVLETTKPIE